MANKKAKVDVDAILSFLMIYAGTKLALEGLIEAYKKV